MKDVTRRGPSSSQTNPPRESFTWALYALVLTCAILQAGVGGMLPFIAADFSMSHTVQSLHITAMGSGGFIMGLLAERIRRRIGRHAMLIGAALFSVVAAALLAGARSPAWSISALALAGISVTTKLIVGQAHLVARYGGAAPRMIGEVNLAYSIGAVLATFGLPVLVSAILGWRMLPLIQAVALLLVLPMLLRGRHGVDAGPPEASRVVILQVLRRPRMAYLAMCLSVAVEWSFLFWLATNLVSVGGLPAITAATATAVMWATILVLRAIGSRLLASFGGGPVLTGSLIVTIAAAVVLQQAETVPRAMAAAVLAGAAIANLYPASIALVVSGFPHRTDHAMARTTLLSSSTLILFPLLLGWLADTEGLDVAFWLVPAAALLALAAVRLAGSSRPTLTLPASSGLASLNKGEII